MHSTPQLFSYNSTDVRALSINDEPWFVLSDLCKVLNVANPRNVAARLDDDMKGVRLMDTLGGTQNVTIVSEAGMYEVVLRSDKPVAKAFRRWLTTEVLPAIRRQGGYISPAATEHQMNALILQARSQMELCQAAKGLIHPDHLEARARVVLARGLDEHAELDQSRKPLYTQDFLKGKNLSRSKMKSVAGVFGKRVKKAYSELHGTVPEQYPLDLPNGQVRQVNAYTEADRPLMEQVWNTHYEGVSA